MSSWLSGGISQFSSLTDQISTFTKEVITESTQEIEDPVTELQLARKRIEELEGQNAQNHEEFKRSRRRIQELEDRAETAELQVTNNNHEYRKLIQERDNELKKIRKQCSEIREQQKKLVFSSDTDLAGRSDQTDSFEGDNHLGGGDFKQGEEEYDWWGGATEDVDFEMPEFQPHSHSQISQLQSEVARLQVECQHWKDLARQNKKKTEDGLGTDGDFIDGTIASEQLQELQQNFEQERHRHEHELTTLQALHAQQLEALSRRHAHQQTEREEDTNGQEGEMKIAVSQEMEKKNKELLVKLQDSQAVINELQSFIGNIKYVLRNYQDSQLKQLSTEKETLKLCVQDLQESYGNHHQKMSELQSKHTSLESETEQLNTQVEVLQRELKAKETEMDELKKSGHHELVTEEEYGRGSENNGGLDPAGRDLDPTIVIERYQKELEELKAELLGERGIIEVLQKQLSEEQTKREGLERQLKEATADNNKTLSEALASREGLEKELAAIREETQRKTQEHLTEDNRSKNKMQVLEAEVQRLQNELKVRLEWEELAKGTEMSDALKIKGLKTECDKLQKELEQVQGILKKKDEDIKRLTDHAVSLEAKIRGQGEELNSLNSRLSSSAQEAGLLRSQLGGAQSRHEEEKKNLKLTAEQRIVSLEQRVTEQVSRQQALEKLVETRDVEIQSLRQEREGVVRDLERKGRELVAMSDTLAAMTASLERKEEELVVMRRRRAEELQRGVVESPQDGTREETEVKQLTEQNQSLLVVGEKHQKELKRLRAHLMQVEEQHTHEQLQADHRENQLRMQLKVMEERISSAGQEQSGQIPLLRAQLSEVTTGRDAAMKELMAVKARHQEDLLAVQNLQAVLEDFQQGHSQEINMSMVKNEQELNETKRECQRLATEKDQTKTALDNMSTTALGLEEKLKQSKAECYRLSSEVSSYQAALSKTKMKIEQMSSIEGGEVDRSLVKNLFLTYLSSEDKKKGEIVQLIGKILEISPQELDQSLGTKSGWLPQIWRTQPSTPVLKQDQDSFSKLFVSFLEAESSTPKPRQPRQPPVVYPLETTPNKDHPPIPSHLLPTTQASSSSVRTPVSNSASVLSHLLTNNNTQQT